MTVPDDLIKITLNENPIQMKLKKLFKNSYSMLGLNSNIIENFDVEKENITRDGKIREKNIIKMIRDFDKKFNIFIFNYKTEIWNLFKEIQFDVILYETEKNFTSMRSILELLILTSIKIVVHKYLRKSMMIVSILYLNQVYQVYQVMTKEVV